MLERAIVDLQYIESASKEVIVGSTDNSDKFWLQKWTEDLPLTKPTGRHLGQMGIFDQTTIWIETDSEIAFLSLDFANLWETKEIDHENELFYSAELLQFSEQRYDTLLTWTIDSDGRCRRQNNLLFTADVKRTASFSYVSFFKENRQWKAFRLDGDPGLYLMQGNNQTKLTWNHYEFENNFENCKAELIGDRLFLLRYIFGGQSGDRKRGFQKIAK